MIAYLKTLSTIFSIVRLVDVSTYTVHCLDDAGNLEKKPVNCFEVWGKTGRCDHCISSLAFKQKTQLDKFEFIGSDVYYVISKYVEFDGKQYVLELVNKVDDTSFLDSIDQHLFVEQIQSYNKKLYVDPLTGAYNRLYFEEQVQHLRISALALFDLDHFKEINDTCGHLCGDEALHMVCKIILNNIRSTDSLIRYGGDEFLIVFSNISAAAFPEKLEMLREQIEGQCLEKCPDAHITISMGGIVTDICNEEILSKLDARLYRAKILRNCVVVED